MKACLQFNLDNEDDRLAHLRCVKSLDMALAMWTFSGRLRSIVDTSENGKYIDEKDVWDAWEEVMVAYGIDLNELVV